MKNLVLHSCEECGEKTHHTVEYSGKTLGPNGYVNGETHTLKCRECGEQCEHKQVYYPKPNRDESTGMYKS